MSGPTDKASVVYGPQGGGTFPAGSAYDTLVGTTGEDSTSAKLTVGRMATILVGAAPIRFTLRGATGAANQVAATDPLLPAYGRYDWTVQSDTCVVYVQSGDASTAFEAWVHHSSPG